MKNFHKILKAATSKYDCVLQYGPEDDQLEVRTNKEESYLIDTLLNTRITQTKHLESFLEALLSLVTKTLELSAEGKRSEVPAHESKLKLESHRFTRGYTLIDRRELLEEQTQSYLPATTTKEIFEYLHRALVLHFGLYLRLRETMDAEAAQTKQLNLVFKSALKLKALQQEILQTKQNTDFTTSE